MTEAMRAMSELKIFIDELKSGYGTQRANMTFCSVMIRTVRLN